MYSEIFAVRLTGIPPIDCIQNISLYSEFQEERALFPSNKKIIPLTERRELYK